MNTVLAHGVAIPAIGFGTWQLNGEDCARMVEEALTMGYRHIDTAANYRNETEVGQGLKAAGLPRDQVFVTTKVWMSDIGPGKLQASAEASLKRLGLDRVDLLLIHWPNAAIPLKDSLGALADAKRRGLARAIGVSNFPSAMFQEAVRLCPEPLVANQVEYHPFLTQKRVMAAVRGAGAAVTAYSPLARGRVLHDPVIQEIATAHGRTTGQVTLRWLVQQDGVVVIPKTADVGRARANLQIFDFALSDDEMARISALGARHERVVDGGWCPEWDPE